MAIGLTHYLTVAAILFTIGVFGIFVNRKNVIIILMSVELILLAVNINFVAFSAYLHDVAGQPHEHWRWRKPYFFLAAGHCCGSGPSRASAHLWPRSQH